MNTKGMCNLKGQVLSSCWPLRKHTSPYFNEHSSSAPDRTSICPDGSSIYVGCPKQLSVPALPPFPAPPASSSDFIHPGVQAKNLDSISNLLSTNSAGLALKYIQNAITSDHLHCHHQLSPGYCWGLLPGSPASADPTTIYFQPSDHNDPLHTDLATPLLETL